jgi:hypothetical protein
MAFGLRTLLAGPFVPAVLAGVRVGETAGWVVGAAVGYGVLALAQVVTVAWTAAWDH